jgi:hypothetical protein
MEYLWGTRMFINHKLTNMYLHYITVHITPHYLSASSTTPHTLLHRAGISRQQAEGMLPAVKLSQSNFVGTAAVKELQVAIARMFDMIWNCI